MKERSAATAAENRPVYKILVYAQDDTNPETRTHEDKDPVSIPLPAFDHFVVFFLCSLGIHGKEGLRAVTEVGFYLRWLVWCQLRMVVVDIYYRYQEAVRTGQMYGYNVLGPFPLSGSW